MTELNAVKIKTYENAAIETIEEQASGIEEAIFSPNPAYVVIKRIFDFVSSLAVSLLLIVPIIIISVVIIIKDPGNPFYFHKRMGKNFSEISVLKFRSMKKGADDLEKTLTSKQLKEYRKEYKLADDPRLIGYKKKGDGETCFGAKIRQLSIDEIPQIVYNILIKGNMSVVGPRPILGTELEENYTPEEQKLLLSVKPGLTGYWQVYARNNAGYEDGKRQKMELYYVHNRSLLLDIKIILKTVVVVFFEKGAVL